MKVCVAVVSKMTNPLVSQCKPMENTVLGPPYGEQLSRAHVDDLQSSPYLENFQGTTYSPDPWSLALLQFTIPLLEALVF